VSQSWISATRIDLTIDLERSRHRSLPREFARAFQSLAAHLGRQCRIGEHAPQPVDDRSTSYGIDEHGGIAGDLGQVTRRWR
jgi:hypothetical protein